VNKTEIRLTRSSSAFSHLWPLGIVVMMMVMLAMGVRVVILPEQQRIRRKEGVRERGSEGAMVILMML
jgi:hypothetical protein